MMIVSILCGGSGTRLWPLSRELMPKQFIPLINNGSLFQQTLTRNLGFSDEFFITTNDKHYFLAQDEVEHINASAPKCRYILESISKNTAPALLFVALSVKKSDIILALPSDHIIKNDELYKKAILEAQSLAKSGHIALFGIKPTSAHVGYGYIKSDRFGVAFSEKPDLKKAKEYLKSGEYYWNSGMFCFKAETLINEFKLYKPELLKACISALKNADKNDNFTRLKNMDEVEDISIDYAIMEKSKKLKLVKADFYWNDLGNFSALKSEYPLDSNKNATNADLIALDSKNNLIISEKTTAIIGINDLIVVDTNDSLLISKESENQRIKEVVNILKKSGSELCKIHKTAYRPWGSYTILLEYASYKIKQIVVKPKKRLSLQKHFHRNEHWVVVSGSAIVHVDGKECFLKKNQSTYIPMGSVHRLENPGKIDLVIVEVQVGEYLGEDDIVRLEDDYGR